MNFTDAALGINKHDLNPNTCLKKQNEVFRGWYQLGWYQQTLVAAGLSQGFRNPDQVSAEQEGLINGSWSHSRVQWSVLPMSRGVPLGCPGLCLRRASFLVVCFPRAPLFPGKTASPDQVAPRWGRVLLVSSQPVVELERESRGVENNCLSPAAGTLWKPLAFGHWREVFHQENSARAGLRGIRWHWWFPSAPSYSGQQSS